MAQAIIKSEWIGFHTLVRREVNRFMRIWTQTLLPSPISIMLYFVIFGNLIGPRIGSMEGYDYIEFIAPGLIMMAVINNAFSNVVASFYGARFQKNIEEMLVAPLSNLTILMGFLIGGTLRGLIVDLIVTCVALIFTSIYIHSIWIVLASACLTALLFSLLGFLNGMFAKKFDDINIIPTFVLTPLTYLGGIFYSVNLLPDFWRGFSHLNPIFYMVNAFREGMLGVSDVNVGISLGFISVCIILLFSLTLYLMGRGVGLKQ
jgi:ABC-2 type transport system permease protein